MTTGNISSADMMTLMANVKSQNGIISSGTQATDSFQNLFSQNANKTEKSFDKLESMDSNDSAQKAFNKNNTGKTKDILKAAKEDKAVDDGTLTELENGIKDVITEELGISEEELLKAMSESGLTFADLLVPQNVSKLIAEIKNVEPAMIVTDSNLTEHLADIVNAISELTNQIATTNQIPVEDVEGAFKEFLNKDTSIGQENTTKDIVQTVTVVTDENTGKEITITMEGNRVTETTTTSENVQTAMMQDDGSKESFNDNAEAESNNNQSEAFAGNILNNLSDSIQSSASVQSDFTQVYNVNQADVINQLIDSIKVNVTADTSTMELQLTPESLGKINLTVVAKDGNITASITAQNDTVKAIIESQLIQLKEALNNQGLKVTEVEVSVFSGSLDNDFGDGREKESDNQTGNRRRFRGIEELGTESFETDDSIIRQMMEDEGNSVNFKA